MTIEALFAADPDTWKDWEGPLQSAFAERSLDVNLSLDARAPDRVDYIIFAPDGPVDDFRPFHRAKAVFGLWAGVENIVSNPTLTQPLTRMVDPGLTEGMVEWVTGHVLRHHLGLDAQLAQQDGVWRPDVPPLARHRRVSVLGLGALGSACANVLSKLNFQVTGWSRQPKSLPGIVCLHGRDGLKKALETAEILVLLLPLTPETQDILDASALARLPHGSVVLNPGRGPLIDDMALLSALDSGAVGHATLDVFRAEPLPPEHSFWHHPKVTVTPHIASATRAETAATVVAENMRRGESGETFLHLVNRDLGY